jgi:hypothetical protein
MGAGAPRREHVGEQQSLGDLGAVLVALPALALAVHVRPGRDEGGEALGGEVEELLDPQRPPQVVRQLGVELVRVGAQEALPRVVQRADDGRGAELLALVATRALRKPGDEALALGQEGGRGVRVGVEAVADARAGLRPRRRLGLREPGRLQEIERGDGQRGDGGAPLDAGDGRAPAYCRRAAA